MSTVRRVLDQMTDEISATRARVFAAHISQRLDDDARAQNPRPHIPIDALPCPVAHGAPRRGDEPAIDASLHTDNTAVGLRDPAITHLPENTSDLREAAMTMDSSLF